MLRLKTAQYGFSYCQSVIFFFFVSCIAIACTERSMLALRLCIRHWARSATHTEAYTMSTVSLWSYHVPAQSHESADQA